jgi:histidine triad (HIT) family protein
MSDCIFCKILSGDIPSYKVYEDEKTLAFLDIFPVNPGHTLIIPKHHSADLLEAPREDVEAILETARKIAPGILQAVGAEAFNVVNNRGVHSGQSVFHTHFHLIPRFAEDGHQPWRGNEALKADLPELAEKIKHQL